MGITGDTLTHFRHVIKVFAQNQQSQTLLPRKTLVEEVVQRQLVGQGRIDGQEQIDRIIRLVVEVKGTIPNAILIRWIRHR